MLGFLESPFIFFFFYGVRSWLLHFEYSEFSLMNSKKPTTRRIKNPQHVIMPANCAEISKVTSGDGNWILRDLGPPEAKAFDRKFSSCIRLWNTTIKNWSRHHLENFISFPLIYKFVGIRRVLTELEADNWKHRSNYTVTLNSCFVRFLFFPPSPLRDKIGIFVSISQFPSSFRLPHASLMLLTFQ